MAAAALSKAAVVVAAGALVSLGMAGCGGAGEAAPTPSSTSSVPSTGPQTSPTVGAPQQQAPRTSGPSLIPNPNGDGTWVPCEGTICTNPNHGAGTDPADNGGAEMLSPDGSGELVPCEGTICTNPNYGAGTDPADNGGDG
ncbi:hypothetical protein [uncultured Mycolicibacterium sp.]|uniref:hypothetical protein n=1 Tax=uncultured Mycolicibacterium sp. TaxID=2320817 RepID=UPI0026253E4C|nr:hypothetical protein [uncultured Mycolicibacterium sp.]